MDAEDGEEPEHHDGELTFIGAATVLLRLGSFTILTDPSFLHAGERARLGAGVRRRRLTEPAMQVGDLPALDLVLLSQFHGDHFDRVAARELDRSVPIVTEPHAARKLARRGFRNVDALETWGTASFRKGDESLEVVALPARRSPALLSPVAPPVTGTLVELSRSGRPQISVYVTGDTLLFGGLGEIARRYPAIDLCIMHLGGARLAGVLLTMDDRQGVEALRLVSPHVVVPVHYDDYSIFRSPLEAFLRQAGQAGQAGEAGPSGTEVREVRRGETWRFSLEALVTAQPGQRATGR